MNQVLFTSDKDDWETPNQIFVPLHREFKFVLDVCAVKENSKCKLWLEEDCLGVSWAKLSKGGSCWMNPPYGNRIGLWVSKAYQESLNGVTVVCLLPARTDTIWFHDYCQKGEVRFIRGRITFQGATNPAPFPSMVVVFRGKKT